MSADADSNQPNPDADEFEQALSDVEQSLFALKERYAQVQRDQQRQAQLKYRREEIRQSSGQTYNQSALKTELQQIKQELETIELNLESKLVTFSTFKEPFWQAVRFGGLGIVIGWLLKACSG